MQAGITRGVDFVPPSQVVEVELVGDMLLAEGEFRTHHPSITHRARRRTRQVLTCAVRHTSCRERVAGICVRGVCASAPVSMEQSPQLPAHSPPLRGEHVPPPAPNPSRTAGMMSAAGSGREGAASHAANAGPMSTHAPAAASGTGGTSASNAASGGAPHRQRLRVDVEKSVVKYKVRTTQK